MNKKQVLSELKKLGNENTKKIFQKHGADGDFYGVKVGDLKKVAKKIKGEQELALDLYASGNLDAMYLAGLVADGSQMTKAQLRKWASNAPWYMVSEYTVAWVAAESKHGWDLGLEWIERKSEHLGSAGWATLSSVIGVTPDDELDKRKIKSLLKRIAKDVHKSKNRVKYTMNGFVIAVGTYCPDLTAEAKAIAEKVGKVDVEMGGTACKVPFAPDYIEKVEKMGRVGNKRKTAKC